MSTYTSDDVRLYCDGVPVASLPHKGTWLDRLNACPDQCQIDHITDALRAGVIELEPEALAKDGLSIVFDCVWFEACDGLHLQLVGHRQPDPLEMAMLYACHKAGWQAKFGPTGWEVKPA